MYLRPLPANDARVAQVRRQLKTAEDAYLIGNFHRDSEGDDLLRPKLVKGPDLFVEIVKILRQMGQNIHIVLAGPRRHWIRQQLQHNNIPFTFFGEDTGARDDKSVNIQSKEMLNILYNILDLYIVSSRSEGGPQSIMEGRRGLLQNYQYARRCCTRVIGINKYLHNGPTGRRTYQTRYCSR